MATGSQQGLRDWLESHLGTISNQPLSESAHAHNLPSDYLRLTLINSPVALFEFCCGRIHVFSGNISTDCALPRPENLFPLPPGRLLGSVASSGICGLRCLLLLCYSNSIFMVPKKWRKREYHGQHWSEPRCDAQDRQALEIRCGIGIIMPSTYKIMVLNVWLTLRLKAEIHAGALSLSQKHGIFSRRRTWVPGCHGPQQM